MFERPAHGREWFELTIGDQLALGRPDHVELVFGRKIISRTPGRFRTRVITDGVEPQIQAYYKHSKVKQYFKEGRALRTETTINDPNDFGIGRLLTAENWNALMRIGRRTTSGCSTPSSRRAIARPTRSRSSGSCRRRSTTA